MISFVVPAYNAQDTIDRTLKSVRAQTSRAWEAVVVDDGSTDDTAAIVERWAGADQRIRLLRQANGGPSQARNLGVRHAAGEHVTFLDADDTVEPGYIRRMASRLSRHADAEGVCCGSRRRGSSGRVIGGSWPQGLRTDPRLACRPGVPAPIHALLIRTARVLDLGGFDETLRTSEDWDLWIRMVNAGVKIVIEPRTLVTYWGRDGQATRDGVSMLRDHEIVLARSKVLVEESASAEAEGGRTRLSAVLWNGGVAIGDGRDPTRLAEAAPKLSVPPWYPAGLAVSLLDGLAVGSGSPARNVLELWPRFSPALQTFLTAVEAQAGFAGLAYQILKAVEKEAIRRASLKRLTALTRTLAVPIGMAALTSGVKVAPGCDSAVFKLGAVPRMLEAPSFGDLTGAEVRSMLLQQGLRELLLSSLGARLRAPEALLEPLDRALRPLGRSLKQRLRKQHASKPAPLTGAGPAAPPRPSGRPGEIIAEESEAVSRHLQPPTRLADKPRVEEPYGTERQDSLQAWDEFFEQPDPWGYDTPYEQVKYDRTLEIIPEAPLARALELACAEGRFTERLAQRADHVRAVDISSLALSRAAERCERFSNIDYVVQNFFDDDLGSDWSLIVCCEVLYYMNRLERLAPFARRVHQALAPGGYFIQAHAYCLLDDPDRTGFDWSVPFGAAVIAKTFESIPGMRRVRSLRTALYEIDLFQRDDDRGGAAEPPLEETLPLGAELETRVARQVVWNGAQATRDQVAKRRAFKVPVLMYHRVAETGPADLAPYRVTPEEFESQLLFLRRRGFRPTTLAEWRGARRGGSMEGRPVLITFDDAYVDFCDIAWPLLSRYDFTAHVFVPTDKVGASADWDAGYGESAPIMGWEALARLAMEGVSFGSHLGSHPWADCLDSEALLREAARSKAALETVLGQPVTSVAPPFGATNARVDAVLRLAGYGESFLDQGGVAPVWRLGLSTPRIEVRGGEGLDVFAAKLELAVEPPNARDRPPRFDRVMVR